MTSKQWVQNVCRAALALLCLAALADDTVLTPFSKKGKYGFRDRAGKHVIEPQFDYASDFSDGFAAVGVGKYPDTKWGYIDPAGRMIIAPQFEAAHDFSEGMAAVQVKGKLGYINKTGAVVVPPQFDEAQKFAGGKARVRVVKLGYGFINKKGEFIGALQQ